MAVSPVANHRRPHASAAVPDPQAILAACLELAREAERAPDARSVAEVVARIGARLAGADQATVGLVDRGEVATVAAVTPQRIPLGSRFPIGFGVAGWVAATGRPAEIADVREDRRYVALPYPQVRSFVGVPLAIADETVGVLSLAAWRPHAFPEGMCQALAPFAESAALAVRHAREDEAARARLASLETQLRSGLAEALHELKSPLTAAAGFIEIVAGEQAGPLNAQQREFLEMARTECARLKDELARAIEEGAAAERPLEPTACEASALLATAVERARGQATAAGAELVVETDPRTPAVLADREATLRVLANLLDNAFQVAPRGSQVHAAAAGVGDWVCFMVADRGPGLPAEAADRLFDRFQRGPSQDGAREPGHAGLGLWLSRQAVERQGGRFWAENRAEGGARFCFALPRA